MGLVSITLSPNLWGWWSDMHNHAFDLVRT